MTPPADPTTVHAPDPPTDSPVDGDHVHDVLIVGGGPSGSSCAYWLAEAGWDVVLVEKKVFPARRPVVTA